LVRYICHEHFTISLGFRSASFKHNFPRNSILCLGYGYTPRGNYRDMSVSGSCLSTWNAQHPLRQFRHECGNDTVFSYRSRKWFLCSRRKVSFFFRRDKPRIRYTSRLPCSVKCHLSFFRSTDIWFYRYSNARRGRIWFLVTACQD